MKKHRLFILSSILIIISLFTTAVTCNLCGTPINIGEPTTESEPETGQQDTRTIQEQAQETEQAQSTEEPQEDNHSPVIEKIKILGEDIEVIESEGLFDEFLIGPGVAIGDGNSTIEAYDEDGDELEYIVYDNLGTYFDVTKIDNNNAEIHWIPPDIPGAYTLFIEASDGRGGTDSDSVDMNFVELPSDTGAVGPSEGATSILADSQLSGVVYEDESVIFPASSVVTGDTDTNLQIKGFMSFDISELHGKTVQDADINFINIGHHNNPGDFASFLVVKVFYFGNSLTALDFEPGGVTIANIPIDSTSYTIHNDTLIDELQRVLDEPGRNHFQIKLGLNAKTNNDEVPDLISLEYNEAGLGISYLD